MPLMPTPMPAAVACTPPQAPSAKPLIVPAPLDARSIAAVSMPTENSPPPRPMKKAPVWNSDTMWNTGAKITAAKAMMPASMPSEASR